MDFILLIIAYLIGSFPTAYLLGKWLKGQDIRTLGSKNIGATNAQRVFGNKIGLTVFLIDALKGALIILLFRFNILSTDYFHILPPLAYGCAAILGHDFPIFMHFKGGKGVATSCGILLAFNPILFLVAICVFIITLLITRYVSLGSILASICTFAFATIYLFQDSSFLINYLLLAGMAILAIARHHTNIKRLLNHEENHFKLKNRKE